MSAGLMFVALVCAGVAVVVELLLYVIIAAFMKSRQGARACARRVRRMSRRMK